MKHNFKIGDFVLIEKAFSQAEVNMYNDLIGDTNPIHFDEVYCQKTIFKTSIVPGLLVSSLFGGLLGSKLPGTGTIYLGQNLKFKKPVYIDELVKALIRVVEIRNDKPIIRLSTIVYKKDGEIAIEGDAIVMV